MHRWIGGEVDRKRRPARRRNSSSPTTNASFAISLIPLIEPPHSRPAWKSVFGDYKPLPSPWRQGAVFDRTAYGRMLIDEPHRSHASRYAQLIDDVRDDITRFEPFFATAVQRARSRPQT